MARNLRPSGLPSGFRGGIALTDGTIHHQDIRRALGLPRAIPAHRLVPVLTFSPGSPHAPLQKQREGSEVRGHRRRLVRRRRPAGHRPWGGPLDGRRWSRPGIGRPQRRRPANLAETGTPAVARCVTEAVPALRQGSASTSHWHGSAFVERRQRAGIDARAGVLSSEFLVHNEGCNGSRSDQPAVRMSKPSSDYGVMPRRTPAGQPTMLLLSRLCWSATQKLFSWPRTRGG